MSKTSREEEGGVRGRPRKLGLRRKADDEEDSPTPRRKKEGQGEADCSLGPGTTAASGTLSAAMEVLKTIGRPSTKAPGPRRCARSTTRS